CIISSKTDGEFNGCIVNTVFQVTPEPPTIAVSVSKQNLTHEYVTRSKVFVVSILAEDAPLEFIGRFGFRTGRDIDKFQEINYRTGVAGVAIVLDNTVGFIEAEVTDAIDVETHTLFIGKITACETIDSNKIPMTYNYYRDVKGGVHKTETESKIGTRSQRRDEKVQVSYVWIYLRSGCG
ncbi:MAG: flavin reductase family protein, partial [Planctomycetota bacterium]